MMEEMVDLEKLGRNSQIINKKDSIRKEVTRYVAKEQVSAGLRWVTYEVCSLGYNSSPGFQASEIGLGICPNCV